MSEFKGTKGKWEVVEHSWSDTSIVCNNKNICTNSIYHEATEKTQEKLENIEIANFKLIASAPELLEQAVIFRKYLKGELQGETDSFLLQELENIINKATK